MCKVTEEEKEKKNKDPSNSHLILSLAWLAPGYLETELKIRERTRQSYLRLPGYEGVI